MSRSTFKYLPLYQDDLKNYFLNLIETKKIKRNIISKKKTINVWNNFYTVKLHQGKYSNVFKTTDYHIGVKFGEFTKTRKPFFFRSKKKR